MQKKYIVNLLSRVHSAPLLYLNKIFKEGAAKYSTRNVIVPSDLKCI
jgi:sulfur relay (sulfurtransferase) DsrC/TusE family protein